MGNLLAKNVVPFTLIGLCLTCVAYLQLSIPYLLSLAVANIKDFEKTTEILLTFTIFFVGKSIAQGATNCINTYLESTIRLDLITYIYKKTPLPVMEH